MTFQITILGSNSAVPAHGRNPSAQVVEISKKPYLIDCGEGTQMRFSQYGIKSSRIEQIFISHLHGDHYFGLIGLISSYHLLRRNKPLDIFSPTGLEEIIRVQLEAGQTELCYPLHFHIVDTERHQMIFENRQMEVWSLPLNHRIPCSGFMFREKKKERRINKELFEAMQLPHHLAPRLKAGEDVQDPSTGEFLSNKKLTLPPNHERSYAYCSDTAYYEPLIDQIKDADILYHDCTFDKAGTDRAVQTYHGTTEHAATIAQKAGVSRLLIGHFSAKYEDLSPLLEEAREIFPETELALEGEVFQVEAAPVLFNKG